MAKLKLERIIDFLSYTQACDFKKGGKQHLIIETPLLDGRIKAVKRYPAVREALGYEGLSDKFQVLFKDRIDLDKFEKICREQGYTVGFNANGAFAFSRDYLQSGIDVQPILWTNDQTIKGDYNNIYNAVGFWGCYKKEALSVIEEYLKKEV